MSQQREVHLRVWFDGTPWEQAPDRVLSLEIDERSDGATRFVLRVDLAPIEGDWDLLADPQFSLLRRVTIALSLGPIEQGEPGAETVLVDGYVTGIEVVFGPQRIPDSHLALEGFDGSCLMHLDDRIRTWTDRSDADIVKAVLGEYGFGVDVDPTSPARTLPRGTIVQRGTDAELVRLLARRNGVEWWMERGPGAITAGAHPGSGLVGHFHKPRLDLTPQPPLTVMPRELPTLAELTVRWESHHPTTTHAQHLDERSRRVRKVQITRSPYRKLGARSRAELLAERLKEVLPQRKDLALVGLPFADVPHEQKELETLAAAELQDEDWLLCGKGTVQTLRYPEILRARRPVEVQGAGKLLDGVWYVRSVLHRWIADANTKRYEAEVDIVRNAMGAP